MVGWLGAGGEGAGGVGKVGRSDAVICNSSQMQPGKHLRQTADLFYASNSFYITRVGEAVPPLTCCQHTEWVNAMVLIHQANKKL